MRNKTNGNTGDSKFPHRKNASFMMLIDDTCTGTNGEEGDILKMVTRKILSALELKTEKKACALEANTWMGESKLAEIVLN